jgi:hypothetical protein
LTVKTINQAVLRGMARSVRPRWGAREDPA